MLRTEKARTARNTVLRLLLRAPDGQLPQLLRLYAGLAELCEELSLLEFDELTADYSPDQPRDRNGRWTSGGLTSSAGSGMLQSSQEISATGANKFEKGFSEKNLAKHWKGGSSDHSGEYPGWTKEQYADRALNLIQSSVGGEIYGYKNAKGQIARYDNSSNDYVIGNPEQGIATMFKPTGGKNYFDRLKERDGMDNE